MSFMPNVGTRVKLVDGREATIETVSPTGTKDSIRLDDGSVILIDAWQIAEVYE